MHTLAADSTLTITGLDRLTTLNACHFKELTQAMLKEEHRTVDVDLSRARFMDSDGLGALVALQRCMAARQGRVRLLHPVPFVQQLLELVRLHQVFQIVHP